MGGLMVIVMMGRLEMGNDGSGDGRVKEKKALLVYFCARYRCLPGSFFPS
jgi:hypothetical protein